MTSFTISCIAFIAYLLSPSSLLAVELLPPEAIEVVKGEGMFDAELVAQALGDLNLDLRDNIPGFMAIPRMDQNVKKIPACILFPEMKPIWLDNNGIPAELPNLEDQWTEEEGTLPGAFSWKGRAERVEEKKVDLPGLVVVPPPLGREDDSGCNERVAGGGRSATYHSKIRLMMAVMHEYGHRSDFGRGKQRYVTDGQLAKIFIHGLLNFYFAKFSGDVQNGKSIGGFNLNYQDAAVLSWKNREDQALWGVIWDFGIHPEWDGHTRKEWNDTYEKRNWFVEAGKGLRQNPVLLQIGANFQRQKIRVEKLEKHLEAGDFLLLENQQVELQQMILRSWIQVVARAVRLRYDAHIKAGTLPKDPKTDPFIAVLHKIQPDFLADPYWQENGKLLVTCDLR